MAERFYTIPLRKEVVKARGVKKANKAVSTVRNFLSRHMRSEDVRLSTALNSYLWSRGIHHPPSKVKVRVDKDDKGIFFAKLHDEKVEAPKKEKKAEKKEAEKPEEPAKEPVKEEPKAEASKEKPKEEKVEKKAEAKPEKAEKK